MAVLLLWRTCNYPTHVHPIRNGQGQHRAFRAALRSASSRRQVSWRAARPQVRRARPRHARERRALPPAGPGGNRGLRMRLHAAGGPRLRPAPAVMAMIMITMASVLVFLVIAHTRRRKSKAAPTRPRHTPAARGPPATSSCARPLQPPAPGCTWCTRARPWALGSRAVTT